MGSFCLIDMKKKEQIIVFLYLLHIFRFFNFGPYVALGNILSVVDIIFAILFFVNFIKYIAKPSQESKMFDKSMVLLYILFLGSVFVGLKGGQNILRVVKWYSSTCLQFGFFFYLVQHNVSTNFLLKTLKNLFICFVFITGLSYLQYPNCWFGVTEFYDIDRIGSFIEDRGILRFYLPGKIIAPFLVLYRSSSLNFRGKNLLVLLFLFFIILINGSRFPLVACLFTVILMVVFSGKFQIRKIIGLGIMFVLVFSFLLYLPFTSNIISSFVSLSETSGSDGISENNIRLISSAYFFTEYNGSNLFNILLGNGIDVHGDDAHSKMLLYASDNNYFLSDVGYAEMFIYFGAVGLLLLLLWFLSSLINRVERDVCYLKFFFLYLMIVMFCGDYWYSNLYIVSIASYIYVKHYKEKIVNDRYNK